VVGAASNGAIALQRIPQFNPDVLTLDIEMPEMDGLETLRRIRREYPQLRVIMFSTLTERGAAVTLEALTLGADDYVTKASNEGSLDRSMARLREELIPKIKQFFHLPGQQRRARRPAEPGEPFRRRHRVAGAGRLSQAEVKVRPKVVVIGVSTGGPTALGAILPQLPAGSRCRSWWCSTCRLSSPAARRASSLHSCRLPVEGSKPGRAGGRGQDPDRARRLSYEGGSNGGGVRVYLDQSPPQNSCRPAVDALFASIGEVYGGAVIAVILTGMGQDGLRGAEILKAQGASVLAQDEASSVVWGMPGAVVNAGLADRVLPLDQVVPEILRRAGELRGTRCRARRFNRGDPPGELPVPSGACLFPGGHRARRGQALPVRKPPRADRQATRPRLDQRLVRALRATRERRSAARSSRP
jgi:two-component system, chemotaxis family, protein-glutamate methylesterase/glutaminase